MIISRAPCRVSLLGGGTDYPCWFHKHGGMVVGGAINKHSFVTARYLPPFHDFKHRIAYREVEAVATIADVRHRAVRATIEKLGWFPEQEKVGLEITHVADLPGQSGTGSSSTFVVALVNALATLKGKRFSPAELAELATTIEREGLQETVGCQDQAWAAHGGLNVLHFRPSGDISVMPLLLSHQEIERLQAHLMLFFTRQSRVSSQVAATYALGLGQREREQWAMMRLAEAGVSAIYQGNYERLGNLIDQAWRIKAGLADGVTTAKTTQLYTAARICGAFGGKLTGAGGGGCLLLVAPPEKQADIVKALEQQGAVHVPFRFDFDGAIIIFSDRENIREYRPAA